MFFGISNFISVLINTLMHNQDSWQLQKLPWKHRGFLYLLGHFLRNSSLPESDSTSFLSGYQNTLCVCVCVCAHMHACVCVHAHTHVFEKFDLKLIIAIKFLKLLFLRYCSRRRQLPNGNVASGIQRRLRSSKCVYIR